MISVRPAKPADYPAIGRIQAASPEAAQWPLGDYSAFSMLVAIANNAIAGFCAWRQTAPDEAELLNLAVGPAFRRQGVAQALIAELARTAQGDLFLEVAAPNLAAIALYESSGFQGIGVRPGYYGHGKIPAVVMKKRLC